MDAGDGVLLQPAPPLGMGQGRGRGELLRLSVLGLAITQVIAVFLLEADRDELNVVRGPRQPLRG